MLKVALTAMVACAIATPVFAGTDNDPFVQESVELRFDGIDLATVDGQRRLEIRMDAAADAVCGARLDTVHLHTAAKARECHTQVLAEIRDQIETRLAAMERSETKLAQLASRD